MCRPGIPIFRFVRAINKIKYSIVNFIIVKTVMMAGDKRGRKIVFCDITITIMRTSEVWAAHFMVTLTPAHTSAHVLHGDTDVGAGVVGVDTNILTVLI